MVTKNPCFSVTVSPKDIKGFQGNKLFMYTVVTFLVVLAIYFGTKDWKGVTTPEEVDLGIVTVPRHMCRRKHRRQDGNTYI